MSTVRSFWCCAAALTLPLFTTGTLAALDEVVPASTHVRFKTGTATLPVLATAADRAAALAKLARPDAPQRILVQFQGPVPTADRRQLQAAGLTLLSWLGDNAFFATLESQPALQADVIAAHAPIIALAPISQQWKMHPDLAAGAPPAWSIVDAADRDQPTVAVIVVFHPDAPMGLDAHLLAQAHAGAVVGEVLSAPMLVVELPLANVAALASSDSVQWIEPPLPFLTETAMRNDSNRSLTGANTVNAEPYNLTGAGVVAFVFDAGTARQTHQTFGSRLTRIDNTSQSTHATHVAGTVGGDGSGSTQNRHRGMAPGVTLLSAGLGSGGSLPSGWLYTNPVDIEQDYNLAINTHNADLSNNSIGTNVETNGFPCAWQGDYCATDVLIDSIVRGSLGAPFRVVWAAGNERGGTRCDVEGHGRYYSTAPPATAKNHLAIGAVNSNNDSMTTFSSWGPTDDGRMKPDFCGPGCESGGDGGVTSASNSSNTSYTSLCGTSMASPTVCGLSALLLEDCRAQFPALPTPRNSTLKAIFAQTAQDLFNAGPDYQSGYGSVRIVPAIELLRSGRWEEGELTQDEVMMRHFAVTGDEPLKVTLAWDDFPGTPNAAVALVNDLDLRLIDPLGNIHYPWTLDPQNPAAPAVRTSPNRRDNIEQVFIDNPMPGVWAVEVAGFNVPQGPQPFSLAGAGMNAAVRFAFVDGLPWHVPPHIPAQLDVIIEPINQEIIAGSAQAHFRVDDGEFQPMPMTPAGENIYRVVLPVLACGQTAAIYFTAEGDYSGLLRFPAAAPAGAIALTVGVNEARFADSFQINRGWGVYTIPGTGTPVTGTWERGAPIASLGSPAEEFDGDGWCFVTDNRPEGAGVLNCTTILMSPRIRAGGGQATLSYARWYTNSLGLGATLRVEISGNGGSSWSLLETVGPQSTSGWVPVTRPIPPAMATDRFKVRFVITNHSASVRVEAGVDAVAVRVFGCDLPPPCLPDWNADDQINSLDIMAFLTDWLQSVDLGSLEADFNQDQVVDSVDISAFITAWVHAIANGC